MVITQKHHTMHANDAIMRSQMHGSEASTNTIQACDFHICVSQMMSTVKEATWQAAGIQSSSTQQIPQFVPYMPMGFGMGMGMGMVNMCGYSAGGTCLPQFLSVPSSSSTPTRLPLFSGPTFVPSPDQFQVPPLFMSSQAMPTVTTSIVQPQLIPRDFSYTFNPTNQGEPSTSQFITKTAMDHDNWKVPILGEGYDEVLASRMVTPHSMSDHNNVAETFYLGCRMKEKTPTDGTSKCSG